MGCFTYPIHIANLNGGRFERIEALVDTGASYTLVPASILRTLSIAPEDTITLFVADSPPIERGIARALIRIDNRQTSTFVVFGSDDSTPLLGAYALEGLELGVDAVNGQLIRTRKLR